jgi:hypothetical protein
VGRTERESEGGHLWWVYLVFLYENSTIKPGEILLRRGRRGDEGK